MEFVSPVPLPSRLSIQESGGIMLPRSLRSSFVLEDVA